MNNPKKRIFICFCIVSVLAVFSNQVGAIALSFNPSNSDIHVGDTVDIDIVVSSLENDDLAAFDFNINYDDSILTFDSYTLGIELGVVDLSDPLADAEDWSLGDLGGGAINLSEVSWLWDFSLQPDTFTLATVSFTGIGLGISSLSFSNVILGDELGTPLSASLENGSVSAIPEPTTVLLLCSGLISLAGLRRKTKMKTTAQNESQV
jgi:hypothetical protein